MFDNANLGNHHASILVEWESKYSELVRMISEKLPEANFLDLGANTGAVIQIFDARINLKEVFAFEPAESNFEKLVENSKHLRSATKISCFKKAVYYGTNSARALTCGDNNPGGMFLSSIKEEGITNDVGIDTDIIFECCELEDTMPPNIVIDLCKIDVEGSEWNILKNSSFLKNNVKNILLEFHWLDHAGTIEFINENLSMFEVVYQKENTIWLSRSKF